MKFHPDDLALDYELLMHFTPSSAQREAFAKSKVAMPDGSFYIRNRNDLSNAIIAVGRATPNAGESETSRRNAVRRHIMKRARALNLFDMIPDTWNSDGTLKQSGIPVTTNTDKQTLDWLEHFGVKGMRWGVRRESSSSGGSSGKFNPAGSNHPSLTAPRPRTSEDAAVAKGLAKVVKKQGTQALTNQELQTLVTRMNLERQYSNLNPKQVSAGRKMVNDITREMAKQTAEQAIRTYAPKGAAWLMKNWGPASKSGTRGQMNRAMLVNTLRGRG